MLPLQNGGIGSIVRNTVEERSRKKQQILKVYIICLVFLFKKKAWMALSPFPALLPITLPLSQAIFTTCIQVFFALVSSY